MELVLGLQVADWQGRHGLRRFQTAGGNWRLCGLATATDSDCVIFICRRYYRYYPFKNAEQRSKPSHPLWTLSGDCRLDNPAIWRLDSGSILELDVKLSHLIIGMTGGIGSGKTTVTNLFAEQGIDIIDADILAREVVMPGSEGLNAICARYGEEILLDDGTLDRKQLRHLVFAHPEEKQW